MPSNISVENNFIGGLKTEFTGLNFPENAATAASNCVFSIIGDVLRREGIDWEQNAVLQNINLNGRAVNTYKWHNAGGDGSSEIVVLQAGSTIYFFLSSSSTTANPVSFQLLTPTLDLTAFQGIGNTDIVANLECSFTDGNGYLFIFHPSCDPVYLQFIPASNAFISGRITLQIRDFVGMYPETGNPQLNFRPLSLTDAHSYNLQNQGWTSAPVWSTNSTTSGNLFQASNNISMCTGATSNTPTSSTFTVASGLVVTLGTIVNITFSFNIVVQSPGDGNFATTGHGTATGTVTAYSGTSMTILVTSSTVYNPSPGNLASGPTNPSFSISSSTLINTINTWNTAEGNYPSNADVWWTFIVPVNFTGTSASSVAGTFDPTIMAPIIPLSNTNSPNGHFIMPAFNLDRSAISGVPNITPASTGRRPRTGCWFQGRVWYTGIDDSFPTTNDVEYYTWTENIYFSQIVTTVDDFGRCFQQNDPTDSREFDLLPDDGGVIVIAGSGPIYKLFPIQNGIIVFAANGIWIIRGNEGLGFTADDYSVNKLSSVKTNSQTSFVDVLGLPMFWNNEGIYYLTPGKENEPYGFGGLKVEPLTVGTILSFYNNIPLPSKSFARGAYDPISYVVTWIYKSTAETGITDRYKYDSALSLNVYNRAFYPYTFAPSANNYVAGILYVDYPMSTLVPQFKYTTAVNNQATFSEERDNTNWVDWHTFDGVGVNYTSSFTTGYKVHGQGFRKFAPLFINVYSRNTVPTAYTFQSVWDYAINTSSGKISSRQVINNPIGPVTMASGISWPSPGSNFASLYRRHRVPGHGSVLQLEFTSVAGKPFEIYGWSLPEQVNQSV